MNDVNYFVEKINLLMLNIYFYKKCSQRDLNLRNLGILTFISTITHTNKIEKVDLSIFSRIKSNKI